MNQAALDAEADAKAATIAHMVLPQKRHNLWELANDRLPGEPIEIVYGHALKVVPAKEGARGHVVVQSKKGLQQIEGDLYIVCAGGHSSPVVLSHSIDGDGDEAFCQGYHDHTNAYVA